MAAQACVYTQPAVGRPVVLHGCRQFVLRGVALGRLTNAIRGQPLPTSWPSRPGGGIGGCQPRASGGGSAPGCWEAAEVKSIWPRSAGLHTCHKGRRSGPHRRQPWPPPNRGPSSDCALQGAHEAETVSNRASAGHGEARSGSAHTAHHARKACPVGGARRASGRHRTRIAAQAI